MLVWRFSLLADRADQFFGSFPDYQAQARERVVRDGAAFSSLSLFDTGTAEEAISAACEFLQRNSAKLSELTQPGGESEFDFAELVGTEGSFAPSITFDSILLEESVKARVELRVSCYPASDENDPDPSASTSLT